MADSQNFSLSIKAGADAFGDGSHPTTKAAMAALEALSNLQGVEKVLDMGCGSGVLGLQAAYFWHAPVVMVDSEPTALEATRQNAEHNGLDPLIITLRSKGFDHPKIAEEGPYSLIIANILGEVLLPMAPDIAHHLQEEGVTILSGILQWQAPQIEQAYRDSGLTLLQKMKVADWETQLWQKQ
ncbi:MAG: 50S ribosomal protein L11 methyltransferase [Rickettsiales bacterium]|nr:50S ribosomal protein L11 methyltransferase [Rickettsiales bacterium]